MKVYENKNASLENISSRLTLGLSLVDGKKKTKSSGQRGRGTIHGLLFAFELCSCLNNS